jgi:type IV pilus assembly protein PilA
MKKNTGGFTIVELIIVIVVIGILAAIALVAYGSVQSRASASGVKSELGQLGKKIQMYYVDTGTYPTTHAQLESLSWKASQANYQQTSGGNLLYCSISTGPNARFAVAARAKDNTAFVFYSTGGVQAWTGSWSGAWATDCPNYGIPTSGEAGMVFSQGYHPPTWGTPGWRVWTGGIIP